MSWVSPPASATVKTRPAKQSHKPWLEVATPGQLAAVDHLVQQYIALLVADPGAGKTAISLMAFTRLRQQSLAKTMLVVAPLRVCQLVWRQEAAQWSEFRHLKFAFLHGPKKAQRLREEADVYLINPEGVAWLADQCFGRPLPFDIVDVDETTKFKNHQATRSKKLRPRLSGVRRKWGLTGSLVPNGYMDLFGQMLLLDNGAALGRYITHYRDLYFQCAFNGFDYDLQPGADKRIERRIAPYVFRLPYTELPPISDDVRLVEMSPKERKTYTDMKNSMLTAVGEDVITAANAGAVYSKLKQLANGAVYKDGSKSWLHVHDAKLDAIEELVEELAGAPLLIAYEFRHDLERLQKRFPHLRTFDGANEAQAIELERAWNAGEITLLASHPASIGHGLNLQKGAASHIAWFTPSVDYELYDQFIRRLRRRGNDAARIVNHLFIAKDTVDDKLTLPTIQNKGVTQDTLLNRLAEVSGIPAAGTAAQSKETDMVAKLSRQGGGQAAAPQQAQEPRRVTPKGWGQQAKQPEPEPEQAKQPEPEPEGTRAAPKGWGALAGAAAPNEEQEQRGRTSARLQGEQPENAPEPSPFSDAVQQERQAIEQGESQEDPEPAPQTEAPKRTRRSNKNQPAATEGPSEGATVAAAVINARVEVAKMVFGQDPNATVDEGLEICREIMAYVIEG